MKNSESNLKIATREKTIKTKLQMNKNDMFPQQALF